MSSTAHPNSGAHGGSAHGDGLSGAALVAVLASGALFGFGLAASTMVQPESVLAFLRWKDFGLLLVLGGAVVVTFVAYRLAPRVLGKPLFAQRFGTHPSVMDRDTLVGAAIFGIGWGLCGVCPGPAIAGLGAGLGSLWIALAGILAGAWLHGAMMSRRARAG